MLTVCIRGGITTAKIRRPRPSYEIEIDRDLFAYADALKAIEHQQARIMRVAYADMGFLDRLTSRYDGINTQHFASSLSAAADVKEIDRAQEIINQEQRYIASIDSDIFYTFTERQDEVRRFISLYWWRFPHSAIRYRKDITIAEMEFLKDRWTRGGNVVKPFYDYRKNIYLRLAETWGYSLDGANVDVFDRRVDRQKEAGG